MDRRVRRYFYILLVLLLSTGCVYLLSRSSTSGRAAPTLVRAFVAFRHGSRAPLNNDSDVYGMNNSIIWPDGPENLTKKGKMEAYKLGKRLRDRYHHFLGSLYKEEEFRAYTTLKERTMMTGQLVLSALFPPDGYQKWNEDLDWQPIPIYPEYIFNSSVGGGCLQFRMESTSFMLKGEVGAGGEEMKETLEVVMNHAGLSPDLSSFQVFYRVWDLVYMQAREDLPIPEWLKEVYPDKMSHTAVVMTNGYLMGSETQQKLALYNYAMALRTYLLAEEARKMEIHSWSDLNHFVLLGTLGIEVDIFPEPTSTIILELHQASWGKFFEVYYYDSWKSEEPRQLKMPCGLSCPLEELVQILVNKYQVDNYSELCQGGPLNETLPSLHGLVKPILV